MARARADDYHQKRTTILDQSARLFAEHGFDRASMNKIAEACGVSKALLYHYYTSKDALLYDIISHHLEDLIEAVRLAGAAETDPETKLKALIAALLDAYSDADAQHQVQINHLTSLPADQQTTLKGMERQLVVLFSDALVGVNPALEGSPALKPVTMSLFGMLNWHYLWFREDGGLSREDYAEMAMRIMSDGTRNL